MHWDGYQRAAERARASHPPAMRRRHTAAEHRPFSARSHTTTGAPGQAGRHPDGTSRTAEARDAREGRMGRVEERGYERYR